ncbi:hypothetical protein [Nitrosomonas sp.]|uniref:hypothetical protein n=1 Tax=Nitrosomonas sp. TaxID=42353 RepID=UPI0025E588A1|nr:hypothetical protein [Nitrosomonas sp.]MCC6917410.1 hypothetical protein [Nitrosomonas sp.]
MHFPFGCAVANQSIVLTKNFSEEFIDFLIFDAGKVISDKNLLTEDWSKMIWDLLEITKEKCAKRGHSGLGKGFSRQNTKTLDACFFIAGENPPDYLRSIGNGGQGRDDVLDQPPGDDDGGISVLYVQISAAESDENT